MASRRIRINRTLLPAITLAALALALFHMQANARTESAISEAHVSKERAYALEPLIHDMVNEIRHERGLGLLFQDHDLNLIALAHSKDMAKRNFFSHINPDGSSPDDRARLAGFTCEIRVGKTVYSMGENLGKVSIYEGYRFDPDSGEVMEYDMRSDEAIAKSVVTAWMESPGHRENVLREFWEAEGLGIHITQDGMVLVTQLFC